MTRVSDQEDGVLDQLQAAGLLRAGHFALDERTHADLRLGDALSLADSATLDRLGSALAARYRGDSIQVVVSPGAYRDLLLGFIVARELGVPLVTVSDEDGWVRPSAPLPQHARALAVAMLFENDTLPREITALVRQARGEMAGLATLLYAVQVSDGARHEYLASLAGHRWPALACPACRQGTALTRL